MEQWTREMWEQKVKTEKQTAFYLYTPMCGTCAVASKMMDVIEAMSPHLPLGKANLNYMEQLAYDLEIESVPCLILTRDGEVTEKIYAFQSVPYLYEMIKL